MKCQENPETDFQDAEQSFQLHFLNGMVVKEKNFGQNYILHL